VCECRSMIERPFCRRKIAMRNVPHRMRLEPRRMRFEAMGQLALATPATREEQKNSGRLKTWFA
jgi:hypothetical protein